MIRKISIFTLAATATTPTAFVLAAAPAETTIQAIAPSARDIAERLASTLADNFVYTETAQKYAAMLRTKALAGGYDALNGAELAAQITADLQALSPDGHLRVTFDDPQNSPAAPQAAPATGGPPRQRPPAMELERWITPDIAFVRFNLFPRDPEVTARTAQFMADHANAKAIIFDLRTHAGGGVDQMDAIFPWLFDKPTRLVTMATRESVEKRRGSPHAKLPSMRVVKAEPGYVAREHWATPGADPKLAKARVYLLTSDFTGSAAEHFALAMKHSGRGKLIGSHTGGANHFGSYENLGGGFTAFIPVGRTYDPLTGKDWEGVGVQPDIQTSPEMALVKALEMEGIATAEAESLSAGLPMPKVRRPAQARKI